MKRNNQVRQVVFPLLAAFIWGTAFVAQDMCADVIEPMTFNAARSFIAVIILLVIICLFRLFRRDKAQPSPEAKKYARRNMLIGGVCCGTALAVASNFQQAGITAGTDAGKAGFITALYIVLVPLLGLFLKKRVSLPVWIAVAIAVVALYLLCIKGEFKLQTGDLLILLCAFFFAVHILIIDHFTQRVDGMKLSCAQFLVCGILSLIGALIFEHPDLGAIFSVILPILYVGVFSSGVAYTLQILAQKDSNPTVVTILLSMESVFAVISGAIILHQSMTPREYLGCILMLIAVILAQIPFPLKKKDMII
ncbi:MAG: DMT family transporter [Oscillospiraceae bacterium]|nr:DMT family transporter [Oscillospiraceae bacterium]